MADMNPLLANLAAAASGGGAQAAASGLSPDMMQQLLGGGYDPSLLTGMSGGDPSVSLAQSQLSAGKPSARAPRNVALPQPAPQGPPPTPDAQVPQGPPPTPQGQVPQGAPPTPNAPQLPPAPPPQRDPLISQMFSPDRVIHPLAAAGRNGDTQVVHATPGEQMVPAELMAAHPELRAIIDAAFKMHGGNRRTHQVGHPAAAASGRINPETGLQEAFSFMDLLPIALGIAGSTFLGPMALTPALASAGLGAGTAATLGSIAGGTLGSFAGKEIADPKAGPLYNLATSLGGNVAGSVLGSFVPNVGGGANALAGSGANAAANAPVTSPLYAAGEGAGEGTLTNIATSGPGAGQVFYPGAGGTYTNAATGEVTKSLPGLTSAVSSATANVADTASKPFFDRLLEHPIDTLTGGKGLMGAGMQMAGGMLGEQLVGGFIPRADADKSASDQDKDKNNANPRLSLEAQQKIADLTRRTLNPFPSNAYLQEYGTSSAPPWNFFRYYG